MRAHSCDGYELGDIWEFDVDGEIPKPTDDEVKTWKRDLKIKQLIKYEKN